MGHGDRRRLVPRMSWYVLGYEEYKCYQPKPHSGSLAKHPSPQKSSSGRVRNHPCIGYFE
jgi:hypothetical protein